MLTTAFDATTRHAVYLERLKAKAVKDVLKLLDRLGVDLFNRVAGSDLEDMTRKEVQALVAQLNRIVKRGYGPVVGEIENTLKEFGVYEASWNGSLLQRTGIVTTLSVPSDADIWAAMYSRPFQGKFLKGWLDGLESGTARRVRELIQQGYADGKGALELARDLRGTRTRKGVFDVSRRGAETMVRTAYNHTSTVARNRTYAANKEVRKEQHVSVLDHRTSAKCRAYDGRIFDKGKGEMPPLHPACRSTRVPVTSSNKAKLEHRKTYQDWLAAQSAKVQDDILGKAKGKLFRDGGMTVDRFVNRAGQEMTLDQLKAADADAWADTFGE